MRSFRDYFTKRAQYDPRNLFEVQLDDSYADRELTNYFVDLFRRNRQLITKDIADSLHKFYSDENAPKYNVNPNNKEAINRVKDAAEWAKKSVRDELAKEYGTKDSLNLPPEEEKEEEPILLTPDEDDKPEAQKGDTSWDYNLEPEEEEPFDVYSRFNTFNKSQMSKIRRFAKQGMSPKQIAAKMGVDARDVKQLLSRNTSPISPKMQQEIESLAKKGMNVVDIAFHFDNVIRPQQIEDFLKKKGMFVKSEMPHDPYVNDMDMAERRPWDKPYLGDDEEIEKNFNKVGNALTAAEMEKYTRDRMTPTSRQVKMAPEFVGTGMGPTPPDLAARARRLAAGTDPGAGGQQWSPRAIAMELGLPLRHIQNILKNTPQEVKTPQESPAQPKVVPQRPGFFGRMFNKLRGTV